MGLICLWPSGRARGLWKRLLRELRAGSVGFLREDHRVLINSPKKGHNTNCLLDMLTAPRKPNAARCFHAPVVHSSVANDDDEVCWVEGRDVACGFTTATHTNQVTFQTVSPQKTKTHFERCTQ